MNLIFKPNDEFSGTIYLDGKDVVATVSGGYDEIGEPEIHVTYQEKYRYGEDSHNAVRAFVQEVTFNIEGQLH